MRFGYSVVMLLRMMLHIARLLLVCIAGNMLLVMMIVMRMRWVSVMVLMSVTIHLHIILLMGRHNTMLSVGMNCSL